MNRFESAKKASILGISGNIFLLVIKGIIALITHSQSMIADSVNSASDILSSFITFIGNRIASKPKDSDHNLGHGKAEYIYSLLISIIIITAATFVLKESILSLINKGEYIFSIWLIIVCTITIIIKLCLYLYTRKIAKKDDNFLMRANSEDHRNDCIMTSFNLMACILGYYHIYFVDGVVGISISIWMIASGIGIFRQSYDILMDKAISPKTRAKVLQIIKAHKEILKINHFNSTPVGYQYQISFTIFVDGNLSTFASHAIADSLEKEITNKLPEIYLTVIHVNPMDVNKAK